MQEASKFAKEKEPDKFVRSATKSSLCQNMGNHQECYKYHKKYHATCGCTRHVPGELLRFDVAMKRHNDGELFAGEVYSV